MDNGIFTLNSLNWRSTNNPFILISLHSNIIMRFAITVHWLSPINSCVKIPILEVRHGQPAYDNDVVVSIDPGESPIRTYMCLYLKDFILTSSTLSTYIIITYFYRLSEKLFRMSLTDWIPYFIAFGCITMNDFKNCINIRNNDGFNSLNSTQLNTCRRPIVIFYTK